MNYRLLTCVQIQELIDTSHNYQLCSSSEVNDNILFYVTTERQFNTAISKCTEKILNKLDKNGKYYLHWLVEKIKISHEKEKKIYINFLKHVADEYADVQLLKTNKDKKNILHLLAEFENDSINKEYELLEYYISKLKNKNIAPQYDLNGYTYKDYLNNTNKQEIIIQKDEINNIEEINISKIDTFSDITKNDPFSDIPDNPFNSEYGVLIKENRLKFPIIRECEALYFNNNLKQSLESI